MESEDERIIDTVFTNNCNIYDVDIIYLMLPDTEKNTVMYLTRGISSKQGSNYNTHPTDDLTGHYVEGGMTEEMKKAFSGDSSGITAHIKNDKEDKLVCYMPVVNYYTDNKNKDSTKITSLVSAEISLQRVMKDFHTRFRELAIVMLIVTVTVGISAVLILYFTVSKPIKSISTKMKHFVSDRNRKEEFEKLPVKGSDELSEMSKSFNTMAEELEEYIDDVAELNRQKTELNIAQSIQNGLLEPPSFKNSDVKIEASMITARIVGGDLYYYNILENGNVFAAIGDVSGKGITAALFMSRAITLLNQYADLGYSPSKVLFEFNNKLVEHNPNAMFITAFVSIYNPKTGVLTYSNAGHNYPYILADKLITLNTENGIIAGSFDGIQFPEHTIHLNKGDRLFLYTDGVTEAEDKDGNLFGEERLEAVLRDNIGKNTVRLIDVVKKQIDDFSQGTEQSDDITMLVIQASDNFKDEL